jgi:hypothetical protein
MGNSLLLVLAPALTKKELVLLIVTNAQRKSTVQDKHRKVLTKITTAQFRESESK